jgi:predicted outer membrane repeat protein
MYVYSSTVDVFGTLFSGNTASNNGGGIYVYSGTATLVDSPFNSNSASTNGDDVYVYSGGVLQIAEASAGYGSVDVLYSEIYIQMGAMVSKGCKQGEFGTLILESVSGSCNAAGNIGGYADNFPGDNEKVIELCFISLHPPTTPF